VRPTLEHLRAASLPTTSAALALFLLHRNWLRFTDVLIDYGREIYVPWRILEGDVLYRDLAWFHGPLSPYWNALMLHLFGVSLATLTWVNVALAALTATLLYRLLLRASGRLAAGVALLFAVPVFFLGHRVSIGNFNFVSPYSHEMTHGLLAGLAALLCVWRRMETGRLLWSAAAGVCLGLVFLTKAELSLATALGVGLHLWLGRRHASGSSTARDLALLGAGTLAPVLLAFAALAAAMPPLDALYGALGTWSGILFTDVSSVPFFAWGMGTDAPARRLALALVGLGAIAFTLLPAFLLEGVDRRRGGLSPLLPALLIAATATVWLVVIGGSWGLARPLPILLALAIASLRRKRPLPAGRMAFGVFSLALLAKMALNTRLEHYGFVLALPATTTAIVAGLDWLPSGLAARGIGGRFVRASVLGILAGVGLGVAMESDTVTAAKRYQIGEGGDVMRGDFRAIFLAETLRQIERRFPPDAAILVLPEGTMVNYLSRRPTPAGYVTFMPSDLALFGETSMLSRIVADPPVGVVLLHRDTTEYGFPLFGVDYGRRIMDWVTAHYRTVWRHPMGGAPLRPGTPFGIEILEPRPTAR
jgi:hypothetical protein